MAKRQAKDKSPAFQYYPKDLLSDANVLAMTLEEFGAYWKLTSICWLERTIPADMDRLAKMLKIDTPRMIDMWTAIAPCFETYEHNSGLLFHPRLEKEWRKQAKRRRLKQKAARARWDARHAPALQTQCLSSSSPSSFPSSSSSAEEKKPEVVAPPDSARSKRPIFKGTRFVVFEWMLDDLRKLLGPHFEGFDVHEWFFTLSARADAEQWVVPQRDGGKWLYEQTEREAIRRGLIVAGSSTTGKTSGNVAAAARFIARGAS